MGVYVAHKQKQTRRTNVLSLVVILRPATGVAILISPRMTEKVIGEGYMGTRIVWVRIAGPVCNIFYVVVYIPHKGRRQKAMTKDTIMHLCIKKLLRTV